MKVLIITYYWPPSGGSGVQRWMKFVKYLRDFGIEPVVFTVKDPDYAITDESLADEIPEGVEVLKQSIWEPNQLLSKFKSKQQHTSAGFLNPKPSFFERQLHYIRANFFIPDARKFWIKPSVETLTNYLNEHPVDLIITTGPPHSTHLIGLQLKEALKLKWIADFRDPWTDIDYFYQLPLTERSKKKHKELEEKVLRGADAILVVGKTMQENYKKFNKNTYVISNGFDTSEKTIKVKLNKKFSLTHVGMMNADRDPEILWEVLNEMNTEVKGFKEDLQVNLIGKVAEGVKKSIEKRYLSGFVQFIDYVPHQKVMAYQRSSQILLLSVNQVPSAKGIITGKIFEYLQAGRPILALAPEDGDLAAIIEKTQSGKVIGFKDREKLKKTIKEYYLLYKNNNLNIRSDNIEQYHRRNLTKELSEIIKRTK